MRPQYLILAEASVTESTVSAMDTMMTVLYLGCGFYCLLLWFRLRRGAPISASCQEGSPAVSACSGAPPAESRQRPQKIPAAGICQCGYHRTDVLVERIRYLQDRYCR